MNNCSTISPNEEMKNLFRLIMKRAGAISIKDGLRAVTNKTGFTVTRARDLWHGRGCVRAEEIDIARKIAGQKEQEHDATLLQRLDRIESLLAALAQIDPEFHSPDINGYGRIITRARNTLKTRSP